MHIMNRGIFRGSGGVRPHPPMQVQGGAKMAKQSVGVKNRAQFACKSCTPCVKNPEYATDHAFLRIIYLHK